MEINANWAPKITLSTKNGYSWVFIVGVIGLWARTVYTWESNTFLQLHNKIAGVMNWTNCWMCSQPPKSLGSGHPVIATIFSNDSRITKAFQNMSLKEYIDVGQENLNGMIDSSSLLNDTQGVPCVQRCQIENITGMESNIGGNRTSKGCENLKFVGDYPNCTSYISYGSANTWASKQTR